MPVLNIEILPQSHCNLPWKMPLRCLFGAAFLETATWITQVPKCPFLLMYLVQNRGLLLIATTGDSQARIQLSCSLWYGLSSPRKRILYSAVRIVDRGAQVGELIPGQVLEPTSTTCATVSEVSGVENIPFTMGRQNTVQIPWLDPRCGVSGQQVINIGDCGIHI
jgi:hypothetical protein